MRRLTMEMGQFNQSLQLSLEQEFQMKVFQESAQNMSREQALSLLVEASRLLMIKDNVIKNLVKNDLNREWSYQS
ncbi:MAG: NblA/ycf18 family protein [Xenococcaceae cyanobacterium]